MSTKPKEGKRLEMDPAGVIVASQLLQISAFSVSFGIPKPFHLKSEQLIVSNPRRTSRLPNSPSFNSPKLPQPIFLPTRKLGPTMSTPEEPEEPEGRDEWPLRLPCDTLVLRAGRSPYLSLCGSMARGPVRPVAARGGSTAEKGHPAWAGDHHHHHRRPAWSLAARGWCSHCHGNAGCPSALLRPHRLTATGEAQHRGWSGSDSRGKSTRRKDGLVLA